MEKKKKIVKFDSLAELRSDNRGYDPVMQDDKHLFLTFRAARTLAVTAQPTLQNEMALRSEARHFL